MDLTAKVSAQPGAAPIEGLPDAWHWSRVIFNFDAILTPDHRHVLEMRVMGPYDPALAHAVLAFARTHSEQITTGGRPLTALPGFTCPGWNFDTVAAASPAVHNNHTQDDAELHRVTYTLFPGYHYEFSETTTEEEARYLFQHALQTTKLDRTPVPFLKMRYDNTRTQGGSIGPDRGLAPLSVLRNELALLDSAAGSWVEWENRHGHVHRAETGPDGALTLHSRTGSRQVTADDLLAVAEQTVLHTDDAP